MEKSFLVRLQAVAGDLFLATPIDSSARPSHPIALPGDPWWPEKPPTDPGYPAHPIVIPPVKPGDPTVDWVYVPNEGWYRKIGPVDKPRPLPPAFEGEEGKWVAGDDGWYWTSGPYDKPKPPGPIPPEEPPIPTPPDIKYDWVYGPDGWYFYIGPMDKPRPIGGSDAK